MLEWTCNTGADIKKQEFLFPQLECTILTCKKYLDYKYLEITMRSL
jgi:hypothetical protein